MVDLNGQSKPTSKYVTSRRQPGPRFTGVGKKSKLWTRDKSPIPKKNGKKLKETKRLCEAPCRSAKAAKTRYGKYFESEKMGRERFVFIRRDKTQWSSRPQTPTFGQRRHQKSVTTQ